ncbi:MAG TPA: AraC family transcriptional regulator [Gemmatimonadaceae bacterium]
MSATPAAAAAPVPTILACVARERARALVKHAFPRRRARLLVARGPEEFAKAFGDTLVDAAIVDVAAAAEDQWKAAALARDYPSVPFFGLLPLRVAEGGAVAQCAALGFADVLAEGIDDPVMRDLVLPASFTARFARALVEPPASLGLDAPLQRGAWSAIVAHAGRPVRTAFLASRLAVSREHLSRSFAAEGGANLKRVIDLVRLIAAAELSKNPGHDVRDVARVLEFASASHLSSTAQRVVGTRPSALARLRTVDLIDRFTNGHSRSRAG